MLKWIGSCFKFFIFAIGVLIAGNTFHWHGLTVSEYVKLQMKDAKEKGYHLQDMKNWANEVFYDVRKGTQKKTRSQKWERATSLNDILEE